MQGEAKASIIPNFLEASTPSELRLLCLKNNLRLGGQVNYFSIVFDSKGNKYIAWFLDDVQDQVLMNKKV